MSVDRDEDYMTKLYISNKPEVKKKYISPLIESYEYDDVDGEPLASSLDGVGPDLEDKGSDPELSKGGWFFKTNSIWEDEGESVNDDALTDY